MKFNETIKSIWNETWADMEALSTTKGLLVNKDFYRFLLPAMLMGVVTNVKGQQDLDEALDESKEQLFSVFDWAFIIVIVLAFLIGAVGLTFGLAKVFSGKASEGVTALLVGVVAIIVTVTMVGVFYSFYQDQRDNL